MASRQPYTEAEAKTQQYARRYETMERRKLWEDEATTRASDSIPRTETAQASVYETVASLDPSSIALNMETMRISNDKNSRHTSHRTESMDNAGITQQPSLERELAIYQQEEAEAFLKTDDFKGAQSVMAELLCNNELTAEERVGWIYRQAETLQMLGRWQESEDVLSENPDKSLRGWYLQAEARFQQGDSEEARKLCAQAMPLVSDKAKEYYPFLDLMARIAEAAGRASEARFYKSKANPGRGMVSKAVALEQQRRARDTFLKQYSLSYEDEVLKGKDVDVLEAFAMAARLKQEEMVAMLLTDRSLLQRKNSKDRNRTAFYYAIRHNNISAIQTLVTMGADVNEPQSDIPATGDGSSGIDADYPLCIASGIGSIEAIKLLLDLGGDVNKYWRYSPLHVAAQMPEGEKVIQFLLEGGADPVAANRNCSAISAIAYGDGYTPLHLAAACDRPDAVTHLCKNGVSVNLTNRCNNMTALHPAALSGSLQALKALCDLGAEINIKDKHDTTPLYYAVWYRRADAVRFLCRNGAEIDMRCFNRRTALHAAALCDEDGEIVDILCKHGADVNALEKYSRTPLDIVEQLNRGNQTPRAMVVKRVLLKHNAKQAQELYKPR